MKITGEELRRINAYRNTPLVVAARANDSLAEHSASLLAALAEMGLDVDIVMHVLEQRTLRVLFERDKITMPCMLSLMLDALVIGWTARRFATDGVPAEHVIVDPITHEDYDAWSR